MTPMRCRHPSVTRAQFCYFENWNFFFFSVKGGKWGRDYANCVAAVEECAA